MAIVGSLMQIAFWAIVIPTAFYLLTQTVSSLIYGIGMMFFSVMDLLQNTFRKLAGLGGNVKVSGEVTDDLVTAILSSSVIVDVLISVTVFAIGLIIVASIVQIIRLEYTTEGSKNSKEQIFAKAGKSLIMFILIPIICFVGIRVSNYLLVAVDYATSSAGASTVSGCVFASATAEASKVYDPDKNDRFYIDITNLVGSLVANLSDTYGNAKVKKDSSGYYVEKFKEWFHTSATSETEARAILADQVAQSFTMVSTDSNGMFVVGRKLNTYTGSDKPWQGSILKNFDSLSYFNIETITYFYHLGNVNYLILFLGCYFGIKTLFTACMGLISRLYKLAALFIISPAAIGLQPLDDGKAYKDWRGKFISNTLSCYGIIVSLNLYFTIVGVLQTVELWPGLWIPNKFVQFMMVLTGATLIEKLAGDFSTMIGGGDVMADGKAATAEVGKLASGVAKVGMGAMGGAATALGGKLKASIAQHKRGKNGEDSVAMTNSKIKKGDDMKRDADNASEVATKAEEDFNKKYKVEGDKILGSDGKELKGKELEAAQKAQQDVKDKKNTADKKKTESETYEKTTGAAARQAKATSKHYAEQSANVAKGRLEGMMGLNRMGQALNPMQMLGGMDNLLGGVSKYVTGDAFKASDEKYLTALQKNHDDGKSGGVDVKSIMGDPEKVAGSGVMTSMNKQLGDVFGAKSAAENHATATRVQRHANNAENATQNANLVEQTNQALDTAKESAVQAKTEAQTVQTKLEEEAPLIKMSDETVNNLSEAIEEAMSGSLDKLKALNSNSKLSAEERSVVDKAMSAVTGDTVDNTKMQGVWDEFVEQTGEKDKRDAYRAAGQVIDESDKRVKAIEQAQATGFKAGGKYSQGIVGDAVQEAAAAAGSDPEAFAEALGKILGEKLDKIGAGDAANGGKSAGLSEAVDALKEALKADGIKAELKDMSETKFKIDDTNITKALADIQAKVAALDAGKDKDDDGATLKEILKQLKKNGKSK